MESDHLTTWVILVTSKLGKEVPNVPLLTLCDTKDLCGSAVMPCSRLDLMDRNCWSGLGEETAFHQVEQTTQQDPRPPT